MVIGNLPHRRLAAWTLPSLLSLAGLVVIAPGATAAPLSPCAETDNGNPQIHSISFSPASVDVTEAAREVKVRVAATDTGGPGPASGLVEVRLAVAPPAADFVDEDLALAPVGDGLWETSFTVPRGAPVGDWQIRWAGLRDAAGNALEDTEAVGYDYLAPFHDVTLDVTSMPDATPPEAKKFLLSERVVDNRRQARTIRLRVTAVDEVSGLRDGEAVFSNGTQWETVDLSRIEDDREFVDTLVGVVRLPRGYGAGRWKAQWLNIRDHAGNTTLHRKTAIGELGRRWFRVLGDPDFERPRVLSTKVDPSRLDVREEGERTTVRMWLADAGSGIRSATVLMPYVGAKEIPLRRVRGTEHRGLWVGRLSFGTCFNPRPVIGHVRVLDRNLNPRTVLLDRHLTVKALDNKAPTMRLRNTTPPPAGPLRIVFSEKVNGIDDETLTVRELTEEQLPKPPTPGTWTCTDPEGASTPCTTGNVLKALWQPKAPLAPARYLVTANPDGVLGLTDLRGNPVSEATENQELADNVALLLIRPEE